MRRGLLGDSSATDGIVKNREDVVVTDRLVRIFSLQSNGSRRVVSPLEFFQHALSKRGRHNAS
jgi:hypothetical protein